MTKDTRKKTTNKDSKKQSANKTTPKRQTATTFTTNNPEWFRTMIEQVARSTFKQEVFITAHKQELIIDGYDGATVCVAKAIINKKLLTDYRPEKNGVYAIRKTPLLHVLHKTPKNSTANITFDAKNNLMTVTVIDSDGNECRRVSTSMIKDYEQGIKYPKGSWYRVKHTIPEPKSFLREINLVTNKEEEGSIFFITNPQGVLSIKQNIPKHLTTGFEYAMEVRINNTKVLYDKQLLSTSTHRALFSREYLLNLCNQRRGIGTLVKIAGARMRIHYGEDKPMEILVDHKDGWEFKFMLAPRMIEDEA